MSLGNHPRFQFEQDTPSITSSLLKNNVTFRPGSAESNIGEGPTRRPGTSRRIDGSAGVSRREGSGCSKILEADFLL
jgi:hypothetical protein